jgi:hypothetical protein
MTGVSRRRPLVLSRLPFHSISTQAAGAGAAAAAAAAQQASCSVWACGQLVTGYLKKNKPVNKPVMERLPHGFY